MQEELDKLMEELKKDIDKINIKRKGTFNNKSNKPYWDLEKKYKDKAKTIRDKYNSIVRGETMNYKYIILDFGKVIAGPATGHWDITPKYIELIKDIDVDKYEKVRKKYGDILSEKVTTLEEEYNMFFKFYNGILSDLNIPNYDKTIAEEIAYDRTYNYSKYTLYDNIYNELDSLKKDYKLIMLTDNWPCVIDYLKHYNLDSYFDKIYVSSIYGVEKKDKTFFDYPIKEYNIEPGEALFIDDNESNLDIAHEKGLDVLLMDRNNEVGSSKYTIINDLSSLFPNKKSKN
ncbi:MAG: HAD-IA family hydrolase [Bacilli bacterium]|nr:HAD-IA family hydrolase [Bacilli bacterium]